MVLIGSINSRLAIVLQFDILAQWYHFVKKDPQAWQPSMHHVMMLQRRYFHLLPTLMIQGYFYSLPRNITSLAASNLDKIN